MKKVNSLLLMALLLMTAACSEKPEQDPEMEKGRMLELSMPSSGSLVWAAGDKIAVVENREGAARQSAVYELAGGAGQKRGTFRKISGKVSADAFTDVFFPATSMEQPEVPVVQYATAGTFDREAVRLSWHRSSGDQNEEVVLENGTSLLTFRLTGNGEKLSEILFGATEEPYRLKISKGTLGNEVQTFQLVVPSMEMAETPVLFKAVDGQNRLEMGRKMKTTLLKSGHLYQFPLTGFQPTATYEELKLAFYNVAVFSKNLDSDPSSEGHIPAIAAMMKEKQVDAMLLAELDRNNKRHDYDQLEVFAGKMGWNSIFAKAFDYGKDIFHLDAAYGNGAAYDKKYKVIDSFTIKFPKFGQEREDRVCLVVESEHFVLAGVHMPLYAENSLKAAEKLTKELKTRYSGKGKPVFLCGDMNARPGDATILELKKDWSRITPEEFTCPATTPTKCLDYMFALKDAGSYEVIFSEVCKGFRSGDVKRTSDHLPIFAVLRYPVLNAEEALPVEEPLDGIW